MAQRGREPKSNPVPNPLPDWKLVAIDGIAANVGRFIKYGAWVLIARYGYLSISALSGKRTLADVALKVFGNFTVSQALAWSAAGGGLLYGEAQRRLRKRTIRTKADGIKELEEAIDQNRSSSRLMPDGSTRPEDVE